MKEISLSKGYVTLVDDEDFDLIMEFSRKWHVREASHTCYAASYVVGTKGKQHMLMHRLITDAPHGVLVDHWDRNGLHNWRKNLRLAHGSGNQINATTKSATGYRGVAHADKGAYGKFVAFIRPSKSEKRIYLGRFSSAESAAHAYDEAAKKFHGEYAVLNFPESH